MGILFSVWPRPSPSPPQEERSCIRSVGECGGSVGRTQFLPPQYVMDIDLQTPGSERWPIRAQLSHQLTNQRTAFTSADTADQSQPSLSSQLIQLTNNSSEVDRVWDNELLNPSLLVCNLCHCHCTAHSGCSLSWAWEHGIFCFSRPRFQCSMLGNSCKYYVYSLNMLE